MKRFFKWYEENSSTIRLIATVASGAALLLSFVLTHSVSEELAFDPAWAAIVLCGAPIIVGAVVGVIRDRDITADVLVSLALVGSLILREWFAAGEVAFIMQIGSILEDFTSARAKKGISALVKITPRKANLIVGDEMKTVDAEEVNTGDLFRVLAGEAIPVDGEITEGRTDVDQSSMTGESMPVAKAAGDLVMSGTVNLSGAITVRATETAENSALQRMIRLAESADAQRAKIVRKAKKYAAWLVVLSLTVAVAAGTVIGFLNSDFRLGFTRAVTILVVFCPCAFVLATPTAISAGIGNAARRGVMIRSGEALERVAAANTAIFDKTGTLTVGSPSVVDVVPEPGYTEEEILKIAASGERFSDHPLAKAVTGYNRYGHYEITDHRTVAGEGVGFSIDGKRFFVGKVDAKSEELRSTVVGVFCEKKLIGKIFVEDAVKENAKETVSELKALGIKTVMLTGDNSAVADSVAQRLGIDEYIANCSPEDKTEYIRNAQSGGDKVAMFGDGVNDSPALRSAYAGIAMGKIGTDAAIESADAVIVRDDLSVVPYLFRISRKTVRRITVNLILSMIINAVAVVLSIVGVLNTVYGALYHNFGSVAVVVSAFLLLFSRDKKRK